MPARSCLAELADLLGKDEWDIQITANQTQVRDVMGHPVLVVSAAGSIPSEYVRCRKFMEGVEKMVDDDGTVTSELEAANREF